MSSRTQYLSQHLKKNLCVLFYYECRTCAESLSIGAAATGPASTGAASTGAAVGPWHGRLSSAVGSSRHLRWRPPAPRCPAPSSTSLGLELMLSPGICLRPTCPTSGVRAHPPLAHNASCRRRRRRGARSGTCLAFCLDSLANTRPHFTSPKEHGGNKILVVIIILDQQATKRLGV